MNRNVESHFSQIPHADIPRSRFDRSAETLTTFNSGDLSIFFWDEVLPGDTFDVETAKLIRMQTPIVPTFGNIFADIYWFFVPNRLIWQHWKEFCGENTNSPWIDPVQYVVPRLKAPSGGWLKGSIAEKFGMPLGRDDVYLNALYPRAYAKVCDDWFRDENLTDPLLIDVDDTDRNGTNGTNYITDCALGGMPFKVSKYHDMFTSLLPDPQKGPDVSISAFGTLPVVGNGKTLGLTNGSQLYGALSATGAASTNNHILNYEQSAYGKDLGDASAYPGSWSSQGPTGIGVPTESQLGVGNLDKSGLVALAGSGAGVSINQLREAFAMQKFYERMALGGSRYTEILRSMFGVVSPDARLQRSEYLGGNRVPININTVVQQSATQAQAGLTTTPQGTLAAYSQTNDKHKDFVKSFTEHGILLGLVAVRYEHVYQQGIPRELSRRSKFEYFWPLFSTIGNQPVFNRQIYAQGEGVINPVTGESYDSEVFGYSEAWCEYRYKPNMITGELRSDYAQSLDVWHLGDDYSSRPTLSDAWIREDKSNIDRCLTVQSSSHDQFFADFFVKNYVTRPMPLYSVPGLIDHF